MKKIQYMAPAIEIVNVKIETLMNTTSISGINGDTGIGMGTGETPSAGQGAWSGHNVWGSFDEE